MFLTVRSKFLVEKILPNDRIRFQINLINKSLETRKMHTDLSSHLHTPECNQLIEELKNCHIDHSFAKFVGICNDIDSKLTKCLKKERIARSAANRAKSAERNQRVHERLYAEEVKKAKPAQNI